MTVENPEQDEQCGCRSRMECCAPGLAGCRRDELPWSLERDLRPVGDCEPARQRQDSLDDQLRDVRKMAEQMGCYDAADWIRMRTL